jgi:hypothetical protein
VKEMVDAGAKFIGEFAKYVPVQAALWLKASEEEQWYLYLASDQIDDTNFDLAYGEVMRIASRIPDPWLSPFEIKVVSSKDPLAAAVVGFQNKYPGINPTRHRSRPLGNRIVEEVFMYPPPATAAI